jgi:hypothetical protein
MSVETARVVFFAIVGVLGSIWILGLRFALARLRGAARPADETGRIADTLAEDGHSPATGTVEGSRLIESDPNELARRITDRLAGAFSMGQNFQPVGLTIRESSPDRVVFERRGKGRGLVPWERGEFRLEREGAGTRVRYAASVGGVLRGLRIVTYLVCFLYGPLFVVGVPVILWIFVLHSEDPAVRNQTLQTLQMVHGVWPPFLMGFLLSRVRKQTAAFFDSFLENLSLSPRYPESPS